MHTDKTSMLLGFCETYLTPFINARIQECKSKNSKLTLLALCMYAVRDDRKLFDEVFEILYGKVTSKAKFRTLWDEFWKITHGKFAGTAAKTLMSQLNDKRFFGRVDWKENYVAKLICAYIEDFCKQNAMLYEDESSYAIEMLEDPNFPPTNSVVAALISIVKQGDNTISQEQAIYNLGEIGAVNEDVIPALVEALQHHNRSIKEKAKSALVKIGPAVIPELSKLLENPDAWVRKRAAALMFNKFKDYAVEALPVLTSLLKHPDHKIRTDTISSLAALMDRPGVTPDQNNEVRTLVLKALSDPRLDVRRAATAGLSRFQFTQEEYQELENTKNTTQKTHVKRSLEQALTVMGTRLEVDTNLSAIQHAMEMEMPNLQEKFASTAISSTHTPASASTASVSSETLIRAIVPNATSTSVAKPPPGRVGAI